MSIWSKTFHEIEIEDLEALVDEKQPETSWLDFKRDFVDIAKVASAFANGHGGIVIIGMDEDNSNKGAGIAKELIGIKNGAQEEAKIRQSCLDSLHPPLTVQTRTIAIRTGPNSGKDVVMVKVLESDLSPHQMIRTGAIYVRMWDVSHYEKGGQAANLNQIQWLLNKRKEAHEQKVKLLTRSFERADLNTFYKVDKKAPILVVSVLPALPSRQVVDYLDMRTAENELKGNPCLTAYSAEFRTAQESSFFVQPYSNNYGTIELGKRYFEINLYGEIFQAISALTMGYDEYKQAKRALNYVSGQDCLLEFVRIGYSAHLFLSRFSSFSGYVDLSISLHNAKGSKLICDFDGQTQDKLTIIDNPDSEILDQQIVLNQTTTLEQLKTKEIYGLMFAEFLRSGGYPKFLDAAKLADIGGFIEKLIADIEKAQHVSV